MARRVTYWREVWKCTSCDVRDIGGDRTVCPTCGSPLERQDGEDTHLPNAIDPKSGKILGSGQVTSPEEIAIATGGADWSCANCGKANRAKFTNCQGCANPRVEPTFPDTNTPVEEPKDPPKETFEEAFNKTFSKEELDAVSPFYPSPKTPTSPPMIYRALGAGAAGILGLLLIAAGIWSIQMHQEQGSVTGLTWQHTTYRERYTKVTQSDWQMNISGQQPILPVNGHGEYPGEFDIRNCVSKFYDYGPKYVCGSEHVCQNVTHKVASGSHERCTHHKNGNGYVTQTCDDVTDYTTVTNKECHDEDKYCKDPINKPYCDYSTYEWQSIGSVETHGNGTENMTWPIATPGPCDRLTNEGDYRVYISYTDKGTPEKVSRSIATEAAYKGWEMGEGVQLQVMNIGTVYSVTRVNGQPY